MFLIRNNMRLKILIFTVIYSIFNIANAQNFDIKRGMPFVKNYSSEDYSAHEQNFDITQGKDGTMYFANFSGILTFNGSTWEQIPTSNGLRAVSLTINQNGVVFIGGLNDFGYLKTEDDNSKSFISLADSLTTNSNIGEINAVHSIDENIYFIAENHIYIADKDLKITQIETKNRISSSFNINNKLYTFFKPNLKLKLEQNGLSIFEAGKFTQITGSGDMWIDDIVTMFEYKNSIIFGTSGQGYFSLNGKKITEIEKDITKYVKNKGMTCGISIGNSKFAFGTLTGGIAISDYEGNIIQIIDKKSNLPDNAVNKLFLDKNSDLWMVSDNGISIIKVNWQLTYIKNNYNGINGKVQKIKIINDNAYIATDQGLFYLNDSTFAKIDKIEYACWDIEAHENSIIAATTKGIYILSKESNYLLPNNEFTYSLLKSKINPNIIYAGQNDKIQILKFIDNKLINFGEIKGFQGYPNKIEEDENGDLFIEVPPAKMYLYKIKTKKLVDINPENTYYVLHINKINNKIFFTTEKGLKSYNKEQSKIETFKLFDKIEKTKDFWAYDFLQLPDGNVIFTDGEQKKTSLITKNKTGYFVNRNIFNPISNLSINTLFFDSKNNNIWMGGKAGLVIFNKTNSNVKQDSTKAVINQILKLNTNSLIDINNYKDELLKLKYTDNSLRIYFSAPIYPVNSNIEYRYFLKGFDNDTSEWNTLNHKDYTNLPDNNYELFIQAKNEFNQITEYSSFKFVVVTPVYRRWWVIIIYIAVILGAGKIILDRRMKIAEKEKDILENLIKERTEEIAKSKEEIELQRDSLYKQRQEIIDSINYAKKIQEAVLPSEEYTNNTLGEHFIFFKPRDIVSGDFYWIKKLNNFIIIVAADCTGHGVPGAFMSMLGSSYLNEIVTRRSLDSAGQILNRLRSKVKKSLHQEGKEGEQKDGMDISLLVLDTESLEVQYSGAYNPLYILRKDEAQNDELIQVKGDRQPIGIHIHEKDFTNHTLQLKKDDASYIFSDGYVDQFGGEAGGKFKSKRFKELLESIQDKTMQEQHEILDQTFTKWKGELNQIDDVIIIGLKI